MQLSRILAAVSTLAIAGTTVLFGTAGPTATPVAADTFPMSPSDPTYAESWINSAARDGISTQDIDVSISAPTQPIAGRGSVVSMQVTLHNKSQATIGGLQFRVAASSSLVDTATSRLRLADGATTFSRLLTAGNISASDGRLGPDDTITLTLRLGMGTSVADDPDPATAETIAAPFTTATVGTYGILFSVQGAVVDGTSTSADTHFSAGGSSRFLLPVDNSENVSTAAASSSAGTSSSTDGTSGSPSTGTDGTSDPSTPRTPLSFLWPLTATVNTVPGETGDAPNPSRLILTNDSLATELSAGGRLYSLLHTYADATTATPALRTASCVAIDPDLLSTVYRMTSGYSIGSSRPSVTSTPTRLRDSWSITDNNDLTDGTGAEAARQWLEDLTTVAQQGCVVALPAANTDLDALARTGDPWLAITALTLGNATIARILNTVPLTNVVIPGAGYLTSASLPLLTNAFSDATLPGAVLSSESKEGSSSSSGSDAHSSGGTDGSSAHSSDAGNAASAAQSDSDAAPSSEPGESSDGASSSESTSSATTYADIVNSLSSMSLEDLFEAAAKVHVTAMQAAAQAGSSSSSAPSTEPGTSDDLDTAAGEQATTSAGSGSAASASSSAAGATDTTSAGSTASSTATNTATNSAAGSTTTTSGAATTATSNVLSPVDWPPTTGRVTALVAESTLHTGVGETNSATSADESDGAAAWSSRRVDLGSHVTGIGFHADLAATLAATGTQPEVASYATPITRYNEALDSSAARMQDAIAVMWQASTTGNPLLIVPPAQWTVTNDEAASFLGAIATLLTTHASATSLNTVVGAVTRTVPADSVTGSSSESSGDSSADSSPTSSADSTAPAQSSPSVDDTTPASGTDGTFTATAENTSGNASDDSDTAPGHSEDESASAAAPGSAENTSDTSTSSSGGTRLRTVASASQEKPAVTATIEIPSADTGIISDIAVNQARQQSATVTRLTLTMRNDSRIALHRAVFTEPLRSDILRALTANGRRSRQAFDELSASSNALLSGNSNAVQELSTAVTLIPPGNVFTRMSASSPVLVAARNGLPLPVSAYVEWTTPDGASEVDTEASVIPARGSLTLQLSDAVSDQPGQLTLSLWLVSADKQIVSEPVTVTIRSAPGMSWESVTIVVGVLLVIAATGIIARERRRNM